VEAGRDRTAEEGQLGKGRMAQIIQFPPNDEQSFEDVVSICKELALITYEHLEAYKRGDNKVDFTEKVYALSGKTYAMIQDMTLHAELCSRMEGTDNS
jgi:hypothetical protein